MSAVDIDTLVAALSVSISTPVSKTLTIKSISTIPQEVYDRDCPLLFPAPDRWLAQGATVPGNFDNVVAGRVTYEHNLSYILAYAEVGTGRGLSDFYAGMAAILQALVTKLMRIDNVATSIRRVAVTSFGTLTDPTGKQFYGCGVTITAQEFVP